jgi:AhpD family alkylhydroperoxidase
MSEKYFYKKKLPVEVFQSFPKESFEAFQAFDKAVMQEGALPVKIKELIAVACTHITQCPYCISGHTKRALSAGATKQEIAEAILIAAALNAGSSIAHSTFAFSETG